MSVSELLVGLPSIRRTETTCMLVLSMAVSTVYLTQLRLLVRPLRPVAFGNKPAKNSPKSPIASNRPAAGLPFAAGTTTYLPATVPQSAMYVGRFLVVAPGLAAYRVSSRSFPNRKIIERDDSLTVVPTEAAEPTDNPYVSYNCVRGAERSGDQYVVIGNGSHVDPVAEKVEMGYPLRDALAASLLALDYEKDEYNTPRIAAVVGAETACIGIVRKDALLVQEVQEPTLVATYEKDSPEPFAFDADGAAGVAQELYDHAFEHEVCAAGVAVDGGGIERAIHNGE